MLNFEIPENFPSVIFVQDTLRQSTECEMIISDDLVIVNVTDKIVHCIRLFLVLLAAVKLQIPELKPLDKIKLRTSKIKEFSKTPDYLPRNNGIYRWS